MAANTWSNMLIYGEIRAGRVAPTDRGEMGEGKELIDHQAQTRSESPPNCPAELSH